MNGRMKRRHLDVVDTIYYLQQDSPASSSGRQGFTKMLTNHDVRILKLPYRYLASMAINFDRCNISLGKPISEIIENARLV